MRGTHAADESLSLLYRFREQIAQRRRPNPTFARRNLFRRFSSLLPELGGESLAADYPTIRSQESSHFLVCVAMHELDQTSSDLRTVVRIDRTQQRRNIHTALCRASQRPVTAPSPIARVGHERGADGIHQHVPA